MPRSSLAFVATALLALASACVQFDPGGPNIAVQPTPQPGDAVIRGRILGPDGAPLAGVAVALSVGTNDVGYELGCVLGELFSLGQAPSCYPQDAELTAADGSYTVFLSAAALTSLPSPVYSLEAVAANGASVQLQIDLATGDRALSDLQLWDPAVVRLPNSATASVKPSLAESGTLFSLKADGSAFWSSEIESGTADLRALEDFAGLSVIACATIPFESASAYFCGSPRAIPAGPAAPSRGASCSTETAAGETKLSPCPVTGGPSSIGWSADPAVCVNGGSCYERTLTVDLGSARPLSLLVVHGDLFREGAEISSDGTSWSSVGVFHETGELSLSANARYLRLRTYDSETQLGAIEWLSIW